ncbi:MAG: hypothetical protein ACRECH_18350 [Nitrososphaerales archaeon]
MTIAKFDDLRQILKVWALCSGADKLFDMLEGRLTVAVYAAEAENGIKAHLFKAQAELEQLNSGQIKLGPGKAFPKDVLANLVAQSERQIKEMQETLKRIEAYEARDSR